MIKDNTTMITAVCAVLLMATFGIMLYSAVNDDNTPSDVPDWANDAAKRLSEEGGVLWLYRTSGDVSTSYVYKAQTISPHYGNTVRADRTGLTIVMGNSAGTIYHYPYDRIACITFGDV